MEQVQLESNAVGSLRSLPKFVSHKVDSHQTGLGCTSAVKVLDDAEVAWERARNAEAKAAGAAAASLATAQIHWLFVRALGIHRLRGHRLQRYFLHLLPLRFTVLVVSRRGCSCILLLRGSHDGALRI